MEERMEQNSLAVHKDPRIEAEVYNEDLETCSQNERTSLMSPRQAPLEVMNSHEQPMACSVLYINPSCASNEM